ALNMSVYTPSGTGGPGKPHVDNTYVNISYNFLTPIDENNTQYIWFQHRNTDPTDKAISEKMNAGAIMAFNEDKEILEAVHQGMAEKASANIDLGLDRGAKTFRRKLQIMIDAEQAAVATATAATKETAATAKL
ncbi:MAG: aromatic ring-hydroxylating dioxygenase subunit alpha, partial [Rhizobiaceae bacterium]